MDGEQSESERALLARLAALLGFAEDEAASLAGAVLGSSGSGNVQD